MDSEVEVKIKSNRHRDEINKARIYQKYIQWFVENNFDFGMAYRVSHRDDSKLSELWDQDNNFMAWVRLNFKKDVFYKIFEYMRCPFPSVPLFRDEVFPELKKVFHSQNSNFEYVFEDSDREIEALQDLKDSGYSTDWWEEEFFEILTSCHNSIIVTDLPEIASDSPLPYRVEVKIDNLEYIDLANKDTIKELIWSEISTVTNEEGENRDFKTLYWYNNETFSVWSNEAQESEFVEILGPIRHRVGRCPARFVSNKPYSKEYTIFRASMFSSIAERIEKYNFYQTCLDMTIPNGAFPIITHYKRTNQPCGTKFNDGSKCMKGFIASKTLVGPYKNQYLTNKSMPCPVCSEKAQNVTQHGTTVALPVPVPPKGVDMKDWKPVDLNANFLKFHHIPAEILNFLKDYVADLKGDIFKSTTGKELRIINQSSKNRDQVDQSNESFRGRLTSFSGELSKSRKGLDEDFFNMKYLSAFREAKLSFGDSFLLETEAELLKMEAAATNPVTKKKLTRKIIEVQNRTNEKEKARGFLLYDLLPYNSIPDASFMDLQVDPVDKELRLNFNKYIKLFENRFGNIVDFVIGGSSEAERFNILLGTLREMTAPPVIEEPKEEEEKD